MVWKQGIKTVGQLKTRSELIPQSDSNSYALPFEETGYYTVCVITQGRDHFRFLIYVK